MSGRGLALGTAALLVALGGCSGDGAPSPPRPAETSESPRTAGAAGPCAVAERRAARGLGMWRVETTVPAAEGAGSQAARDELAALVDRVAARLAEECEEQPAGFRTFVASLEGTLAADSIDQEDLAAVLASRLTWAESVRAGRAARAAVAGQATCLAQFHPEVDATYTLTRTSTPTGLMWLLDVTFDNRTGGFLDGSMSGVIRGTGVQADPFGGEGGAGRGPGRNRTLHWGGSSADFLEIGEGMTTVPVAPEADTDVHTTADGQLEVVEFSVSLAIRGQRVFCTLVPQPVG